MGMPSKILMFFASVWMFSTSTNTLGGGWGIERGRTRDGDAVRLVSDQT